MRIIIDMDRCEGHGQCALTAPELFELDDQGYGRTLQPQVPEPAEAAARQAALACPVAAIGIEG